MRLSNRSCYGLQAMIDIAVYDLSGPTLMKDIAERINVSPKYLDHILSSFRKDGLIKNVKGKNGGYRLARPAKQITLRDIILSTEGSLAIVPARYPAGG